MEGTKLSIDMSGSAPAAFLSGVRLAYLLARHTDVTSAPRLVLLALRYFFKSNGRSVGYDKPCDFFPDKKTATFDASVMDKALAKRYGELVERGYRRYGRTCCLVACRDCAECVPIRLRVEEFVKTGHVKRALRRCRGVRVVASRPSVTKEKARLFEKFLRLRQGQTRFGLFEHPEVQLHEWFDGYPGAIEMDFFIGDRLVAVAIVDETGDALSCARSFYDVDYSKFGLGTFCYIKAAELASVLGKKYLYMGHYIASYPRMSYKAAFRPNELLVNGKWSEFMEKDWFGQGGSCIFSR